jgi:hypothetical protein
VHGQDAGARVDRRRAAVCRTAGARAGWCTAFIGGRGSGTGRGSAGRREDDRAALYGVGQGRTYGGAAFDGLGMRATWGRGKLRWEGTRGPRKAHERLGCGGGRHWDAAGARRRARAGAHSRQKFIRSTPI